MPGRKHWGLLLLLIILCKERIATIKPQGNSQKYVRSWKQFLTPRKYYSLQRHFLRSEWQENYEFPSNSQQHRNAKTSRHFMVANPERSLRIPRDISTSSAEPKKTVDTNPEPGPEWPSALKTWGKARDLHIYLFAVLYVIIIATSVIGLVYDVLTNQGVKALKLTLYLSLLFLGCSRAIIMFADPYSSRGTLGFFSVYITWSLGFPCVLTALGLLLLVFADVTKMNLAPPRFQKLSTALGVTVFNLVLVLITDLLLLFTQKGFILLIICHVYVLILGLILTAGFLLVGFQISNNSAAAIYGDTGLSRLRVLAFITAALNLLFLGVHIYSVIEFGFGETPRAWPWYAVQTSLRALEVSMCVVMFFVVFNNRISLSVACLRNMIPNRFRNSVSTFRPAIPKT